MTRTLRKIENNRTRKNIFQILICFILMIMLIFVVDYRVNYSLGKHGISIITVANKSNEVNIRMFDKHVVTINTTFIRNDINKIYDKIKIAVNRLH